MPELPEVETVANGVDARVRGQRIESVWLGSKPEPFRTPASLMVEQLAGRRIERVRRVGKHIVFDLGAVDARPLRRLSKEGAAGSVGSGGLSPTPGGQGEPDAQWVVHLGMTGRLLVCAADTPVPAHTHAVLGLSSGSELRFVDARRFGRLAMLVRGSAGGGNAGVAARSKRAAKSADKAVSGAGRSKKGKAEKGKGKRAGGSTDSVGVTDFIGATDSVEAVVFGFRGPGSEPMTIAGGDFVKLFRGRRLSIKSALLNQKLLHGVGNIYADESLFRAGIRPRRMAGRLSRAELLRLHGALIEVLAAAIARGGSSVSDYVDASGVKGFFQLEHRVYQRTGLPCLVCGAAIRRIVLGGRSTHYCAICQR